jgi:hypothetical protein
MKGFILILAVLLCASSTNAQKNFEGKILYRLEAEKEEKKPELSVVFSAGRIRLTFKENDEVDDKVILVVPDSGLIYTISNSGKNYKQKKMLVKEVPGMHVPEKKTIMGYATTSAKMPDPGMGSLLGGFISMRNMIFDVADSLHFNIPAKYTDNPELLMIRDGRIVLSAQMTMGSPLAETLSEDRDGESIAKKITVNAIEVTPMAVTAAEMNIPEGYTLDLNRGFNMSYDSTMTMVDTAVAVPVDSAWTAPVKKPTRKPVKKPVKKAPIKSAARKQ